MRSLTSGDRVVHFRSHGAPAPRLPPRLRPSVAGCNVCNASTPIASTTGLRQSCCSVSYVKVRCVRSSARAARSCWVSAGSSAVSAAMLLQSGALVACPGLRITFLAWVITPKGAFVRLLCDQLQLLQDKPSCAGVARARAHASHFVNALAVA